MTHRIVETLVHAGGTLRVIILQRDDGSFGFEDEKFSDDPREQCWITRGRYSESFCDSAERAVEEARGRVDWLTSPTVTNPPT